MGWVLTPTYPVLNMPLHRMTVFVKHDQVDCSNVSCHYSIHYCYLQWVAEWLAWWTQVLKGPGSNRSRDTLSGNSLRQTVHTHRGCVHQAAKMVAALLRVAGVTAGLAESNGSLLPGLWLTSPAGWLPRTGISSGTIRSVIEYGLPLLFLPFTMYCYGI